MSLQIEQVQTRRQLQEFVRVAWTVYQNDPNWVPWLYHERMAFFDKRKNPFFRHAEVDYFIARRDGQAVGTIAAILNHRHNAFHEENVAHFGVWEVIEDRETAVALLDTACDWARARGADRILGPFNLSTNHECGLLVDGFNSPPVVMMTYNPPYTVDFIEGAGFRKAMDLWAWLADVEATVKEMPPKMLRVVNKVQRRYDLTLRNLNMRDWHNEVARVKAIYNSAWEKNWGFVPMTEAEFDHLARSLRPIIDPAITFAVEKDGRPVGFALSLPDANEPLLKAHPRPTLPSSYGAAARSFLNRRHTSGIRVLVLGVLEQYRGRGVDALLYYETAKAALARGYQWAEASWILENNDMMNRSLALLGAKIYKTYRIYEKQLKGEFYERNYSQ